MWADGQADGSSVKHAHRLRAAFLLIVAILLGSAVASRAADAPKRVLILHAYNYTFPATTIASETARKRLLAGSRQAIEIEADFLDLARMPGDVHAMRTANFLREKYAKMHFDLVLVIGTEGVPFIIKYRDVISPGVPVVFAGGSAENYAAIQLPPDVTGVMSGFDLDKMLELAERLQPNVTRFVVIGGSGRADRGWQAATRKAIEARKRKFETAFRVDLTYDAMLAEVSRLPSDTIVLLLSVYADSAGRPLIPRDVAGAVAKASAAPVYGPFGTFLGSGVVGGYVETYESMGIATADLALEILSGKDPATLPPRINPGQDFRVDARAMQRWGLKQSNLPPDSIVMFQEPGLWDEHRNLVLGTISIIVLQALFLAGLLFQRRRRRQAETSLRESEERMTFTAASVNVGLWQFDRTTDELWATEHCRSMFGLAKDVPLTRETFIAAVHPEDRRAAVGTLRGALRGQAAMTDVRVVCPDGGVRWIRVRARSHLDDKGTPDQLNGLFVDITDQKTAETEAEQQRQEVTHLMRVSVMGELSGAIAHEVNQPLTAILTNAETALYLLDQDSLNHAEMRNTLLDIVSEDKRAGEVVQRLRGLLKKGESRSEEVNINELVDSTTALLRSELIRRQVLVESDLGANLAVVLGDSVQLQQVLLNLVVNAMDAMSTTPAPQRRVMIRTLQTPTGDIQVLIKDHGHGIKMANGKQAFEPFYTTKDHGLGLGLSICSTIVRKHGGTINLRNDDAGGAVAEFSLPARVMMMAAQ